MKTSCRFIMLFFLVFFPAFVMAANQPPSSVQSVLQASVQPGVLSMASPQASYVAANVMAGQAQAIAWILGIIAVDTRGSGIGWSLNMNLSHLTMSLASIPAPTNTSPLIRISSSFRYPGSWGEALDQPCAITIRMVTSGAVGVSTFTAAISGGNVCQDSALNPSLPILTQSVNTNIGNGKLLLDFPSGNYQAGDTYTILFDMMAYQSCEVVPQDPQAFAFSSITGLRKKAKAKFQGNALTSQDTPVLSADMGRGMGAYYQELWLSCTIHPQALSGQYQGSIGFTLL